MRLNKLLIVVAILFLPNTVQAWSAAGHHIIAVLAFELLAESDRAEFLRLVAAHPEYERYFRPPSGMVDQRSIDLWRVGVAGTWPDMVRSKSFDRPTWHYEVAATHSIGSVALPTTNTLLPIGATLDTRELHISQAFELCRNVLADKSKPDSDRAVALCWLLHLVGDGHNPLHAGALYVENVLPGGDRGGNEIPLAGRGGNLHSAWDRLLGSGAQASDIRRRVVELQADKEASDRILADRQNYGIADWVAPSLWLEESRQYARQVAYTSEVLEPVTAVYRGLAGSVPKLKLSDEYFQEAGKLARYRAMQGGYRLADILGGNL